MLRRTLVITMVTLIVAGCNDQAGESADKKITDSSEMAPADTEPDTQTVVVRPANPGEANECYSMLNSADTVYMSIYKRDTLVEGSLTYKYSGKDKNDGSINGVMRGDTLIAEYSFISEGINSLREVVFVKKGNAFVEGFGDVEDDRGKMVFKNTSALTFDDKFKLQATDCSRLPKPH